MPMHSEPNKASLSRAVLELATDDPVSALRHVSAWLARRAYPLLGLVCLPVAGGTSGRLLVAVADDGRVERLVVELSGLPEVAAARLSGLPVESLASLWQAGAAA